MDAKTKYTRLVQDVKNEIAKDKAKFDRIKERNRHQEKYKELWEKVNIDEVVDQFAPNSEPIINDSGKIIFRRRAVIFRWFARRPLVHYAFRI